MVCAMVGTTLLFLKHKPRLSRITQIVIIMHKDEFVNDKSVPLNSNGIIFLISNCSTGLDINLFPSEGFYPSLGCPHCADFHLSVVPRLEEEYVNKGLLRIVFVNFPLDKKAMQAALLLQCASVDNYHGLLSRLFDKQRFWYLSSDTTPLHSYAAEYGISYDEAESCLHNDAMAQTIISDRQQGLKQLGMTGTPALLFSGRDGNEIIYSAASFGTIKEYLNSRYERMGISLNK